MSDYIAPAPPPVPSRRHWWRWAAPGGVLALTLAAGAVVVATPQHARSEPSGCRIELYLQDGWFDPICPAGAQPPAGGLASWPVVVYP